MEEEVKKNTINELISPLLSFFETRKSRFLILLFVGIVVGFVVKWNVSEYVTMGYEDYTIEKNKQVFDYKEMAEVVAKDSATSEGQGSAGIGTGAACGI